METAAVDLRAHERSGDAVVVELQPERLRELRAIGVALLIVLNVADIVTTAAFLDAGAAEGNPLADALITSGWIGWIKAALLLALGLRVLRGRPRLATTCMLWFVVGVYTTVVTLNLVAVRALG